MNADQITIPSRGHSHGSAAPKSGSKPKNGPVGYIKVHYGIWKTALLIAEGRSGCIQVITPTKVEVWTVGGNSGK